MKPDDVPNKLVDVAWEAFERGGVHGTYAGLKSVLAAVIPLALAEEREACAGIVQANADACSGALRNVLDANASAIRARGGPR